MVYPNPGNGLFTVQLPLYSSEKYVVEIISMNGAKVFSGIYNGGLQQVDGARLPTGIYLLNINSRRFSKTSKLVIQK
jgi:hypothetical protein